MLFVLFVTFCSKKEFEQKGTKLTKERKNKLCCRLRKNEAISRVFGVTTMGPLQFGVRGLVPAFPSFFISQFRQKGKAANNRRTPKNGRASSESLTTMRPR